MKLKADFELAIDAEDHAAFRKSIRCARKIHEGDSPLVHGLYVVGLIISHGLDFLEIDSSLAQHAEVSFERSCLLGDRLAVTALVRSLSTVEDVTTCLVRYEAYATRPSEKSYFKALIVSQVLIL